jgi:hypothetical protein
MIGVEEMAAYTAAIHPGRTGERWQASAARAHIPAPQTAASMLRSVWRTPARGGVWPAMMNLVPEAAGGVGMDSG